MIAVAVLRLVYHSSLSAKMDGVFFMVLGAGLLLLLVPIQYLKTFKAGGIEFSLEQPQLQGAISGLGLDRIEDEKIRALLSQLQAQLRAVRGSRVLWIDDRPHGIIAERRLLRALEVEIVTAISSGAAREVLKGDNDFDLIVSDVQRVGDSYRETGGERIHEGVNFIVVLRTQHPDPVVRSLPVIFYAAYDWERLVEFTRLARSLYPPPEISNSVVDLIPKAVKLLFESRSTPIPATEMKHPSPAVGNTYGAYADAPDAGITLPPEEYDEGGATEVGEAYSDGEEEEHFG